MLEGPKVDADGNVYFTDILLQRIMRLSKEGVFSVFREKSHIANGLVIDPQGRLLAAEGAASPTAERMGMNRLQDALQDSERHRRPASIAP